MLCEVFMDTHSIMYGVIYKCSELGIHFGAQMPVKSHMLLLTYIITHELYEPMYVHLITKSSLQRKY